MGKTFLLKIFQITVWEFIQNFPIILGFTLALNMAKNQQWIGSVGFGISGGLVGAWTIKWTESKIVPGFREPMSVTITNLISFFLATMIAVVYFTITDGYWVIDAVLGLIFGIGLGLAQDMAASNKRISYRHVLALTCAFIPGMIALRWATNSFLPVFSALLITLPITLIIVGLDYVHPSSETEKSYS